MTLDPTAQNVGVGGMLFLSALWLFLKYKPWKNGSNGGASRANSAGERDTQFWTDEIRKIVREEVLGALAKRNEEIRKIVHEENEDIMEDIRKLSDARNDKIRIIVREELRDK
jgi:hypothetical protein